MRSLPRVPRSLLAAALLAAFAASDASAQPRTVVVLLFDGLAPEAVRAWSTPALDRMRREGAATEHFVPPFPTTSLPAQATISTGCSPARHGIVGDRFLDPERGAFEADLDADWLAGCEHLHQAAQRQGVVAAAWAWIGARSKTRGAQARVVGRDEPRCRGNLLESSDAFRGDAVVQALLQQPEVRPRLLLASFCGPALALQQEGVASEAARRAVEQSDSIVERVLVTVSRLDDRDHVTVLVAADHGMSDVRSLVNLRRVLGRRGIEARALSSGAMSFLYLDDPARADEAARALAGHEAFEVLRKGALPEWAALGDGPRVPDLILSARPPYAIEDVARGPAWLRWLGDFGPEVLPARFSRVASHGYPPDAPGMHGVLYAWGSGITRGRTLERVRAVDLHPTVAHLLGIEPGRPLDGAIERALLAEEATP